MLLGTSLTYNEKLKIRLKLLCAGEYIRIHREEEGMETIVMASRSSGRVI